MLSVFSIALTCIISLLFSEILKFTDREAAKFSNLPICSWSICIFLAFSLLNKSRSYQSFEHTHALTCAYHKCVYMICSSFFCNQVFTKNQHEQGKVYIGSQYNGMWKEKTLFLAYNKAFKFNSPVDILTYLYLHNGNTVITCIHLRKHIDTDRTQTCTNIHPSIFSGTLENFKKHNV